jgi:molecular chaperone GrpE
MEGNQPMAYLYDPHGRRRRPAGPRSGEPAGTNVPQQPQLSDSQSLPTLGDFEALQKAYRELKAQVEAQAKALHDKSSELEIKDEALHKQAEELTRVETELVFTRAALADAQQQVAEIAGGEDWRERYARLQAETENMRRRLDQRAADETAANRRRILADMVPLADHLDLALAHAPQNDAVEARSFVDNIEATRRAFLDTLRRYGIERLTTQGQPFDPTLHEAIGQAPSDMTPADHVAQEVQAGYVDTADNNRLVRPARVIVSMGPA